MRRDFFFLFLLTLSVVIAAAINRFIFNDSLNVGPIIKIGFGIIATKFIYDEMSRRS